MKSFASDPQVGARVEELLREQLALLGVNVRNTEAHLLAEGMKCQVLPDSTMLYFWHQKPILQVTPEEKHHADGTVSVYWRMFTPEDDIPPQEDI